MGVMIMIKRIGSVLMVVLLGIMFNVLLTAATDIYYGEGGTVEAAVSQPRVKLTQRELKKSPDYETSDLYARAHHIIYGDKAPLGPGGRVRIAVVINGEEDFIVEDRVKNQIYSQLRQKFPRDQFAIMKGTDVNTRLLEYAEKQYYDERSVNDAKLDTDGVPVIGRPRGLSDMQLADYVREGKNCGYDYVFLFTLTKGKAVWYENYLPSVTNKQNAWLRVRFVDVNNNAYVYRNDIAATGKGHNGHFNGKMLERAVKVLMQEAMDDIMIEE